MTVYTDEELAQIVQAVNTHGTKQAAADALGVSRHRVDRAMKRASERGMNGYAPVLDGYVAHSITSRAPDGSFVRQVREGGEPFVVPEGMVYDKMSILTDRDNNVNATWHKLKTDALETVAWREALEEFKATVPRVSAVAGPSHVNSDLCCQYTVSDLHFGLLAWREETNDADYDLQIAEKLLTDWFSAAIAMSPASDTAVLAQLGDLAHYDSMESVTPAHKHQLDADSRPQKMIRVIIRVIRRVIDMLLDKHRRVHVVMAKANHDPYSSAWLRESLAVLYEDEPRLTVDTSPSEYYSYEFGRNALFYHHGHKRGVKDLDRVFAGMFRELYGRASHAYGHCGHLHSDAVEETSLMRLERHRTLAAADAYAASGGWLSKRDAKVIVYHREFGEVSRLTLSPEMVHRG